MAPRRRPANHPAITADPGISARAVLRLRSVDSRNLPAMVRRMIDFLNSDPAVNATPASFSIDGDGDDIATLKRNGWAAGETCDFNQHLHYWRKEIALRARVCRTLPKLPEETGLWIPDDDPPRSPHERTARARGYRHLRDAGKTAAAPFSSRIANWDYSDAAALEWLVGTGRFRDLWCCPTCRHFFLAEHGRQQYCSSSCWPTAALKPVTKEEQQRRVHRQRVDDDLRAQRRRELSEEASRVRRRWSP